MPCEGCGKGNVSEYVVDYFHVLYWHLPGGANYTAPVTVLDYWHRFEQDNLPVQARNFTA